MNEPKVRRSPSVVVDGRVYCRVSIPGRLAKWTEGIYLDAEYAEVKTRTGICVIFERTELGAVENVFVVTADAPIDKARAVVVAQRCKLRPEPPSEIGPPL